MNTLVPGSALLGDYNATLVLTETLYLTTTVTVSALNTTATVSATETESSAKSELTYDIPHHPKVDTFFAALFGGLCLLLIIGLIIRKKSKKLKSFNTPLILGTFCKQPVKLF
jgi:hypothetical protein